MNISKIAKLAGVSVATVSRVLNGNGSVKEETRRKILQIVREANYVPSPIARSLSKNKTDTIGIILPEVVDEFFTDFIRGIDEEAYRANQYIMVSSSHSERHVVETLLTFMSGGRVDGVILMAPKMYSEITQLVKKSNRPIVLVNSCENTGEFVSFNINNYQGAYAVTEHLISHGYKKIAMILGPENNHDAEQRFLGFKNALEHHNLLLQDSFIIPGEFTARSGYYGFMRLMSQKEKPEAVFAANDMMAVGAYEAAKSANLKIPRDVALAGFDDVFLSRLLSPRLTTVHVPVVELGKKATNYLLKMINKDIDPAKPHHEDLSAGVVIGGSCGCTPANNTLL